MTTLINLNKARKARDRADAKATADQNAVKFGRTKGERMLTVAQSKQAATRLDGLVFDDE